MKAKMMVHEKMMVAIMIKYLETHQVDHTDPEHPGMVIDQLDPKVPSDQWVLLSWIFMSNTSLFSKR